MVETPAHTGEGPGVDPGVHITVTEPDASSARDLVLAFYGLIIKFCKLNINWLLKHESSTPLLLHFDTSVQWRAASLQEPPAGHESPSLLHASFCSTVFQFLNINNTLHLSSSFLGAF